MSIPKRRLFAPFWDSPPPDGLPGHINPKTIWNNSIPAPSAAGCRQKGYTYKRVLSESVHGVIQAGKIADLDSNIIVNYEKVTPILIIS